ncbi:MAG: enoyl-CoA hydratase/isomerase family protein, partial [Calditrichaeota bacterium]|nr:enoyl-CoA hydratase/isomerase family protein [Calditrichota bacterium]
MPYLQIEHKQGVAVVWLDQPGEKVNKLALEMVDEFRATLDALEKDDRVRAVVLISKKEDTFIAGADLEALMSLTRPGE